MLKPNAQVSAEAVSLMEQQSCPQVPASTFSDEEIRVRAYQIYESSNRTTKHAEADWFQAQTELMEMVGGK